MSECGILTATPIPIHGGTDPNCNRVGLLRSFARRWQDSSKACSLVPFKRFVTGRIPNVEEYPFPYMALFITGGSGNGRSDRGTWARRVAVIHVWVDMDRMEDGEEIAEELRRIYCNSGWRYDYGDVIDVLDHGPAQIIDVNEPTFQYRELIKSMTLCIQQRRYDNCVDICAPCSSGGCESPSSSSAPL